MLADEWSDELAGLEDESEDSDRGDDVSADESDPEDLEEDWMSRQGNLRTIVKSTAGKPNVGIFRPEPKRPTHMSPVINIMPKLTRMKHVPTLEAIYEINDSDDISEIKQVEEVVPVALQAAMTAPAALQAMEAIPVALQAIQALQLPPGVEAPSNGKPSPEVFNAQQTSNLIAPEIAAPSKVKVAF